MNADNKEVRDKWMTWVWNQLAPAWGNQAGINPWAGTGEPNTYTPPQQNAQNTPGPDEVGGGTAGAAPAVFADSEGNSLTANEVVERYGLLAPGQTLADFAAANGLTITPEFVSFSDTKGDVATPAGAEATGDGRTVEFRVGIDGLPFGLWDPGTVVTPEMAEEMGRPDLAGMVLTYRGDTGGGSIRTVRFEDPFAATTGVAGGASGSPYGNLQDAQTRTDTARDTYNDAKAAFDATDNGESFGEPEFRAMYRANEALQDAELDQAIAEGQYADYQRGDGLSTEEDKAVEEKRQSRTTTGTIR